MDRNDLINIIRKADKDMIQEAGFRLAGRPKNAKNKKIDYIEVEADRVGEIALSKSAVNTLEAKPKREISDEQRANLEKGRLALMAKWEKLKAEREQNKLQPKSKPKPEDKDVIRVKSLIQNPEAKTVLIKVKGKAPRKVKPTQISPPKVEPKRIQKEESEEEEEEETEDYEEESEPVVTETETESEMSDAPKSIRKINKRVKQLKKVEQKLQSVTKNSVNPVNPYAQFLKW
jgi:hypothetical protein